jgi:DNA end-binding protein Ku
VDVQELKIPISKAAPKPRELAMAKTLVEQMTEKWDPERYTDDYTSALMSLIKDKIAHGDRKTVASKKPRKDTKVIDLAAVLQESLTQTSAAGKGQKKSAKKKPARRSKSKKAA